MLKGREKRSEIWIHFRRGNEPSALLSLTSQNETPDRRFKTSPLSHGLHPGRSTFYMKFYKRVLIHEVVVVQQLYIGKYAFPPKFLPMAKNVCC